MRMIARFFEITLGFSLRGGLARIVVAALLAGLIPAQPAPQPLQQSWTVLPPAFVEVVVALEPTTVTAAGQAEELQLAAAEISAELSDEALTEAEDAEAQEAAPQTQQELDRLRKEAEEKVREAEAATKRLREALAASEKSAPVTAPVKPAQPPAAGSNELVTTKTKSNGGIQTVWELVIPKRPDDRVVKLSEERMIYGLTLINQADGKPLQDFIGEFQALPENEHTWERIEGLVIRYAGNRVLTDLVVERGTEKASRIITTAEEIRQYYHLDPETFARMDWNQDPIGRCDIQKRADLLKNQEAMDLQTDRVYAKAPGQAAAIKKARNACLQQAGNTPDCFDAYMKEYPYLLRNHGRNSSGENESYHKGTNRPNARATIYRVPGYGWKGNGWECCGNLLEFFEAFNFEASLVIQKPVELPKLFCETLSQPRFQADGIFFPFRYEDPGSLVRSVEFVVDEKVIPPNGVRQMSGGVVLPYDRIDTARESHSVNVRLLGDGNKVLADCSGQLGRFELPKPVCDSFSIRDNGTTLVGTVRLTEQAGQTVRVEILVYNRDANTLMSRHPVTLSPSGQATFPKPTAVGNYFFTAVGYNAAGQEIWRCGDKTSASLTIPPTCGGPCKKAWIEGKKKLERKKDVNASLTLRDDLVIPAGAKVTTNEWRSVNFTGSDGKPVVLPGNAPTLLASQLPQETDKKGRKTLRLGEYRFEHIVEYELGGVICKPPPCQATLVVNKGFPWKWVILALVVGGIVAAIFISGGAAAAANKPAIDHIIPFLRVILI